MSDTAFADNSNATGDAFAVTALGDHQFGSNSIGVWLTSGKIRLGISDATTVKFSGVGILDAQLSQEDLNQAKDLHDQLCRAAVEKPPTDLQVDPLMTYSLQCTEGGKVATYQGRLATLPKDLAFRVGDFFHKSLEGYKSQGRIVVKFDAVVEDVRREKDKFTVSVKFVNGGNYSIRMQTPDQWNKNFSERLDVTGTRIDGEGIWKTDLAGRPILNKAEYPVEIVDLPTNEKGTFVTIPAGGSVTYRFLTAPDGKVGNGTYNFGVLVSASINAKGVFPGMGRVVFTSYDMKSGSATFTSAFPSTSEEWKDYEVRQRAKHANFPIEPGSMIPESGYYRAVSIGGQRSQFVTEFRKDSVAPVLNQQFDRWEWEADLALPARCQPSDTCPRDGRWVARRMSMGSSDADLTFSDHERRFQMGDLMPSLSEIGVPYLYWAWLGA